MRRQMLIALFVIILFSIIMKESYSWSELSQNSTSSYHGLQNQSINLICNDSNNGSGLYGAVFELYNQNNKVIGRYVTDINGKITVNSLERNKQYHFKDVSLPFGYIPQNDTVYFTSAQTEIVVERTSEPKPEFPLTISNIISLKDYYNEDFSPTTEELSFPFEFVVKLGDDYDTMYKYEIKNSDGKPIVPYSYTYKDGRTVFIEQTHEINSGGTVYLRAGETAYFNNDNIRFLSYYNVSERNYCDIYLSSQTTSDHYEVIGNMNGWQSSGDNTSGNIGINGTAVTYTNIRIKERTDVTMSSLAVVNRVLSNNNDTNLNESFPTKIKIGENNSQRYYYEIIHTNEVAENIENYNYDFSYYYRNDPSADNQSDDVIIQKSITQQNKGSQSNIYYPHDFERYRQKNGELSELLLSDDNEISVSLYNDSAVIIYGILTGTHYQVTQPKENNSGYSILSSVNTQGIIQPDLEAISDINTPDQTEMLLRTRADIFNTKTSVKTKPLSIKLDVANLPNNLLQNINVQMIDVKTGITYQDAVVSTTDNVVLSFSLPFYDPITSLYIDYGAKLNLPTDCAISSYDIDNEAIAIKVDYSPSTLRFGVRNVLKGSPPIKEDFIYDLSAVSSGTPLPPYDTTIKITNNNIAFFNEINYKPKGINGKRYYQYTLSQRQGNTKGISYDNKVYEITVEVVENNNICKAKITEIKGGLFEDGVFLFENTYKKTNQIDTSKLVVRKIVENIQADEKEKNRKFKFKAIIGKDEYTFFLKHGQTKIFKNIPIGTKYSVIEEKTEEYKQEAFSDIGLIEKDGSIATFINTYIPKEETEIGSLTIYKELDGEEADLDKSFQFTVILDKERHIIFLKGGENVSFDNIKIGTRYLILEKDYSQDGYITQSYNSGGKIKKGSNSALFINNRIPIPKAHLIVTNEVLSGDAKKPFEYTATIGNESYDFTLTDTQSYTFEDIPINTPYSVSQKDYSQEGYTTKAFSNQGIIIEGGVFARFINIKTEDELEEIPPEQTTHDNIEKTSPPSSQPNTQKSDPPTSSNSTPIKKDNLPISNTPKENDNIISTLMISSTPVLLALWLLIPRLNKIKFIIPNKKQ